MLLKNYNGTFHLAVFLEEFLNEILEIKAIFYFKNSPKIGLNERFHYTKLKKMRTRSHGEI